MNNELMARDNSSDDNNITREAAAPSKRKDRSVSASKSSAGSNDFVQAIEDGAINLVDSLEQKTLEALKSVGGKLGNYEQKITDVVADFEQRAISAVENIDELPGVIDRAVRSNALVAVGIGLGVGAAIRIAQSMVPPEKAREYAQQGANLLARSAANWATQKFT